jgi:hypothetical protein
MYRYSLERRIPKKAEPKKSKEKILSDHCYKYFSKKWPKPEKKISIGTMPSTKTQLKRFSGQ